MPVGLVEVQAERRMQRRIEVVGARLTMVSSRWWSGGL